MIQGMRLWRQARFEGRYKIISYSFHINYEHEHKTQTFHQAKADKIIIHFLK